MNQYLQNEVPTDKQLRKWSDYFHNNGFLVIENVLSPQFCQQLKTDLEQDLQETN